MRSLTPARPLTKKRSAAHLERVARAVEAMRRGRPVVVTGAKSLVALAVETASDAIPPRARSKARLVITHARARTLKIRLYTPEVAAIALPRGASAAELRAIADPTADLDFPLKGPFAALRGSLPAGAGAAVKLAKLAGLLPACVVWQGSLKGAVRVGAAEIEAYDDEIIRTLTIVTRARVPLAGAQSAELIAFRGADSGPEHYAIVIGSPPTSKPVLARLHSECFTGDLLGSLKCDCGSQLRGAVKAIEKAGGGVLLYLAQEGRGIGLINKLRAYRLQDQGFDTMEANERLGFEADERRFGIAARMLKLLGYKAVRLMTNNPHKVAALKAHGVKVSARVPHAFPDNAHNRAYLKTKAEKGGHLF